MSDVRLPPELSAAVAGLAEGDLRGAARRLSEGYRANRPSRQSVPDAAGVAAYAASRMPATYAAVTAALDRLSALMPDLAPRSLIDLGAGPGTASWAAAALWPGLEAVTMVEGSAAFRSLASELARGGGAPLRRAAVVAGDLADPASLPAAPVDVAIVAYALTELEIAAAERLVGWLLARAARIVIVEPGTPRDHGRLMAVRAAAIAAGARVLAPCPHQGACPLPEDDWCHTSVRLPRSRAHMRLKAASVPFEDERHAYLVLEAPGCPAAGTDRGGRILRPPHVSKHEIAFDLCRSDGTLGEARVPSRDRAAFKAAGRLGWGDFLAEAPDVSS